MIKNIVTDKKLEPVDMVNTISRNQYHNRKVINQLVNCSKKVKRISHAYPGEIVKLDGIMNNKESLYFEVIKAGTLETYWVRRKDKDVFIFRGTARVRPVDRKRFAKKPIAVVKEKVVPK